VGGCGGGGWGGGGGGGGGRPPPPRPASPIMRCTESVFTDMLIKTKEKSFSLFTQWLAESLSTLGCVNINI
jgi:hypothetical protein